MSNFTAEFKGPIEGYVVNYLAANFWRVQASMTRPDCMQEAQLVFLRCKRNYEHDVDNPAHFMALFKRSWSNHFTDLAEKDTAQRQCGQLPQDMEEPTGPEPVGELENAGYLRVMVAQAPREVAMVLNLFISAPSELLELAMAAWRQRGHLEAGGNKHVARMLGLPADSRPLDLVHDYFSAD